MKKKNKDKNGKIVAKKFKIDKSFKDPLDPTNMFEELEIEEFPYYYKIHLGIPMHEEYENF